MCFHGEQGEADIDVVIRDRKGTVILSAWHVIRNDASAEEVEIRLCMACKDGIILSAEWLPKPAVLESDCLFRDQSLVKTRASIIVFKHVSYLSSLEG